MSAKSLRKQLNAVLAGGIDKQQQPEGKKSKGGQRRKRKGKAAAAAALDGGAEAQAAAAAREAVVAANLAYFQRTQAPSEAAQALLAKVRGRARPGGGRRGLTGVPQRMRPSCPPSACLPTAHAGLQAQGSRGRAGGGGL